MINILKKTLFAMMLVASVMFLPTIPLSADIDEPLVVDCEEGEAQCDIGDLVDLVERIINWVIMIFAPIAMLMFAWAGILLVTSRGNEGQVNKAKGIFSAVAIGLAIVLSAWIMVYTVTNALLEDPDLPVGLDEI